MPKKDPPILTKSAQSELCANLLIQAAYDFNHLGFGIDDIGIPPKTACAKTCKGHGISDFCAVCNFNLCGLCGGSSNVCKTSMWKGRCSRNHTGVKKSNKHKARVLALLKGIQLPEPVAAKPSKAKAVEAAAPIKKKKKTAKKLLTTSINLPCAMTVGATSAKIVRRKKGGEGGWTLKLSVDLTMG